MNVESIEKPAILYVDDDRENLVNFKHLYKKHYTIHLAESTAEADEILEKNSVKMIIADQRMPGETGVRYLRRIKYRYPDTVMILVTAYTDFEAVIEAINKVRIYRYISKPWDEAELKQTIDSGLEIFDLKKQNLHLVEKLREANQEMENKADRLEVEIRKKTTLLEKVCDSEEQLMKNREELEASLREKEVLLKEIHHRVKNNLQVIVSLLNLMARDSTNGELLEALENCKNRVFSMSMVHDKLYRSESFSRIDFKEYTETLVKHLFKLFPLNGDISLKMDLTPVLIPTDMAVPLGLILNELITNALKYAFPDDNDNVLLVSLRKMEGGKYQLTVADNGVGMPGLAKRGKDSSLGLELVSVLIQQVGGIHNVSRDKGTMHRIVFPVPVEWEERSNGQSNE